MLDGIQNNRPANNLPSPSRRRSRFRLFMIIIILLLLAGGIFAGSKLVISAQKIFEGQKFSFTRLFMSSDRLLAGEDDGEIKILLLGIAGGAHDGPTLTDTMILATIKLPEAKTDKTEVSLFSIPRDLAVEIPGRDIQRINAAFAYGEAGEEREGPMLATQAVEGFLGITIPYYAVVDFQGFKDAVDHVRGIEINVETEFTDMQFPDEQGGYLPPLVFDAGPQTMDGQRALQYVRSRHGNNNQGSDFARARRQQQVLKALKDKVLHLKSFANLTLLNNLLSDFAEHFRTNLEPTELRRLYNLTKGIGQENILSQTLGGDSGLICDYIAPEDGQYLLIPCAGFGDFRAIREFWKNQFLVAGIAAENPKIEIQNAAKGEALASYAASLLAASHLPIETGNFSGDAFYAESVIYDNTGGQKPHTLSYIQETLKIKTASGPFPFKNLTAGGADFVIIATEDIKRP